MKNVLWMSDVAGNEVCYGLPQALTEDELMEVLTRPRNALSRQYEAMFEMSAAGLHMTQSATRAIARAALERGTGARGLRSIMEGLLQPVMYEVGGLSEFLRTEWGAVRSEMLRTTIGHDPEGLQGSVSMLLRRKPAIQ